MVRILLSFCKERPPRQILIGKILSSEKVDSCPGEGSARFIIGRFVFSLNGGASGIHNPFGSGIDSLIAAIATDCGSACAISPTPVFTAAHPARLSEA